MKRLWLFLIPLIFTIFMPSHAHAQQGNTVLIRFAGIPSGSCSPVGVAVNNSNADFYDCTSSGVWNKITGAGGTCARLSRSRIVERPTRWPSLQSSPWILS